MESRLPAESHARKTKGMAELGQWPMGSGGESRREMRAGQGGEEGLLKGQQVWVRALIV